MKLFQRFKFYIELILFNILSSFFIISDREKRKIRADKVAGLICNLLRFRKSVALTNIKTAFSDKDDNWIMNNLINTYKHFSHFFADLLCFKNDIDLDGLDKLVDGKEVDKLLERYNNNGQFIIATGHLGLWELGGIYLTLRGLPVVILAKRQKNPYVADKLDYYRKISGSIIVHRGNTLKNLVQSVRNKKIPVMVGDQDGGVLGDKVMFFNRKASTTKGIPVLSYKYHLPIVPVFAVRGTDGRVKMIVEDSIEPDFSLDNASFIKETLIRYNKVLEDKIKEYPEQYFWFHKRWKTCFPKMYE